MCYVLPNFQTSTKRINNTPRFKTFFILKNIDLFLTLFKFKYVFGKANLRLTILNFFFFRGTFLFFFSISKRLSAHLTNNITQTGVYWNFKFLNEFFKAGKSFTSTNSLTVSLFTNLYLLSLKFINFKTVNLYYKKIFLFFFFISNIWAQHSSRSPLFMNFFFIRNNAKFFKFLSGYFLKVYNI